jgi:simple sugar transport system permease protein
MPDLLAPLLASTIRTATPLAWAALGEAITERSGVINIGLEGSIIAGAFGAVWAASLLPGSAGVAAGFAAGVAAGVLIAALFALFAVRLAADQIITGTAITLLALGLTGLLYRVVFGAQGAALSVPTTGPIAIPGLAAIPVIGPALFDQPLPTYAALLLVPLLWRWSARTHAGLALRAVGESPDAARAAGISPARYRWAATLFGGATGGVAGATLVLAQVGTFAEGMSAGRGFIAVAIVALGRWSPLGTALAALLFGATSAVQFLLQATGWNVPYQLFLAFPYLLTLAALALLGRRAAAPAALGRIDAAGSITE